MSPATVARVDQLRFDLIVKLGGHCAECGESVYSLLEIDHEEGRTWVARETSRLQRIRRYWREYKSGVHLRVLCRSCNARGGGRRYV